MIEKSDYIRLQLDGDQISFVTSVENESDKSIHGSLSRIRSILEKGGLTAVALENAINYTEDLIMPMLRTLPRRETLMVDGPVFEGVVRLLTSSGADISVTIESVENLYRQLADYSQGSKAAWREEMSPEQVALGLVVLREIMHHGGFHFVSLLDRT